MKIHLFPKGEKRKKCLVLVGGTGDTAERFQGLVELLSPKLPNHTICTFTFSSECEEGKGILDVQAIELGEVLSELTTQSSLESIDIFGTSSGAYAINKILILPVFFTLIDKIIYFDPADHLISEQISNEEQLSSWSGYGEYAPKEPVVSEELKKYEGSAKIHVVHLTLRNHGSNGYVSSEYAERGRDVDGAFPRLNTEMVKKFYENTPRKNRGRYLEINNIPHGFFRDGDVIQNIIKVADEVAKLLDYVE